MRILLFNLALLLITFARLIFADESISFDYRFYIEFFKEISQLKFDVFLYQLVKDFPYLAWSGYGQFEAGFALVAYPLSYIFGPSITYALMACVSLFIKLETLRFFKVDIYKIVIFYVFDVILFESNALRAGIALAIIMMSLVFFVKKRSFPLLLAIVLFAALFHTSSLAIFGLGLAALVMFKTGISRIGVLVTALVGFIAVKNLDLILENIGGKLAIYLQIAQEFNIYTGASGLNASSLLCIIFSIFFGRYVLKNERSEVEIDFSRILFYYAMILSFSMGILILFSGIFSIIGDRIWQIVLPQMLIFLSYYKTLIHSRVKASVLFQIKTTVNIYTMCNIAVNMLLFYYVIIGLLVRYPQTNFFSWITGTVKLEAVVF